MVSGPTVAVCHLMLVHQSDQTAILLILRQGDLAHAFTDPCAATCGPMTQLDDLRQ
jgi:hypothetical protein